VANQIIRGGLLNDGISRPHKLATASTIRAPLPDERRASDGIEPMVFYEEGPHVGQVAADSTKVGWTLRDTNGRIVNALAFRINPQGIDYVLGGRATLNAVKSGLFVDDFGPAATVISLRQTIVEGKNAYLAGPYYPSREEVQRFLTDIYLPATAGPGKRKMRVHFHDHHFERGFEQRVVFLDNSLTISRSAEQVGVWQLQLQMVSLERYPYASVAAQKVPQGSANGKRQYRVKHGDTLEKIVRGLAGRHPSKAKLNRTRAALLRVNPQLRKRRKLPNGSIGKPMHVYPGELLALP
jgi:hypothetical protein